MRYVEAHLRIRKVREYVLEFLNRTASRLSFVHVFDVKQRLERAPELEIADCVWMNNHWPPVRVSKRSKGVDDGVLIRRVKARWSMQGDVLEVSEVLCSDNVHKGIHFPQPQRRQFNNGQSKLTRHFDSVRNIALCERTSRESNLKHFKRLHRSLSALGCR